MCIHSLLPRARTFNKVTDQDLIIMYHLWNRRKLSLSFFMVEHMMATAEPIKSTSCLPYGMAMTKVFILWGEKHQAAEAGTFSCQTVNDARRRRE